jgi:hypothetical protein
MKIFVHKKVRGKIKIKYQFIKIEMFINQIRAPLFFFSQSPRFSDLQITAIGKSPKEKENNDNIC